MDGASADALRRTAALLRREELSEELRQGWLLRKVASDLLEEDAAELRRSSSTTDSFSDDGASTLESSGTADETQLRRPRTTSRRNA